MPHLVTLMLCLALALVTGGCGSAADDLCNRLDECNSLNGTNVDECAESTQKELDDRTSSERADDEKILNNCLEFETCKAFGECLGGGRWSRGYDFD